MKDINIKVSLGMTETASTEQKQLERKAKIDDDVNGWRDLTIHPNTRPRGFDRVDVISKRLLKPEVKKPY